MPSGCDVGLLSSASRTSSWWASLKQTLPQGSPKSQEQSKARMRMSGGRCGSECRRQVLVCAGHWRDDRAEQLVVGAKPSALDQSESFRPGRRKNASNRANRSRASQKMYCDCPLQPGGRYCKPQVSHSPSNSRFPSATHQKTFDLVQLPTPSFDQLGGVRHVNRTDHHLQSRTL